MSESKFNPDDMPIIDVDMSRITPYESSQFLDGPEIISVYLAEAIKSKDSQRLTKALNEIAKSEGINQIAQAAGIDREALHKTLKGDDKARLETVKKLLKAVGVKLNMQPVAADAPTPVKRSKPTTRQSTTVKVAIAAKPA